MKYTFLPEKNINVSKLALGTKVFVDKLKIEGKIYRHYLHDSINTIISKAIDNGINMIESTSFYPESVLITLSNLIHEVRKSLILTFRIGYRLNGKGEIIKEEEYPQLFLRKKCIVEDVEKLLRIFKTDYLDIVTVCGIQRKTEYLSEVFDAFVTLKSRGYMRFSGIYLLQPNTQLLRAFDFCQLTYNILSQQFDETFAEISGVPVISCAPFANGILTRKYTSANSFKKDDPRTIQYTPEKLEKYKSYIDELHFLEIKEDQARPLKKTRSFIQGALNFVLQNPSIISTIFCISSLKQLEEVLNVEKAEELTKPQIELIKALYKEKDI